MVTLAKLFRSFSISSCSYQRGKMSKKSFFYAVKNGYVPGVYLSWDECKKQVTGFSKASYKKFPTREDAEVFVGLKKSTVPLIDLTDDTDAVAKLPPGKYAVELMPPSLQPVAVGNSKGTKRSLNCGIGDNNGTSACEQPKSKQIHLEVPQTMVHVYTDGACTNNGFSGARAGIGVYWGPDHPLNVSERLPGRQTNNRAEIHAAVRALKQAKSAGIQELTIYTDSKFMINGVTKWVKNWKRNGWKLSNGQPVINKEDFEALEEAKAGLSVKWVAVPGHMGIAGNEAADRLAVEALSKDVLG